MISGKINHIQQLANLFMSQVSVSYMSVSWVINAKQISVICHMCHTYPITC